ncbi:MAG: tetratricopeptide repeat protein [Pirellulaceae bacterium]
MRPSWFISLLLCVLMLSGCRAIRRTVDSRQSIEARRLSREGLAAMHQDRWDEAEALFQSALELSHSDDRAYWGYSEVLWQKGLRGSAIEHLEKAVRLSAGAPELRVRLGKMYLEEGRVDDAARQVGGVLESSRGLASAWALHGDILVKRNDFDSALAAYHRAVSLDPHCPLVRIAIAEIYKIQSRHDRLLATIDRLDEKTIPLDRAGRIAMMRGIAMCELGQPEEGAKHLRQAIALGHDATETYQSLAAAEMNNRRFNEAQDAIRIALQQVPDDPLSIRLAQQIVDAQLRMAAEPASDADALGGDRRVAY